MARHRRAVNRRSGWRRAHILAAITYFLASIGVIIVSWLAFSAVTGAQIVLFKTGSMSPTMPAGSAAISMPVAVSEIQVGDVVTVRRIAGNLLVTHRVVELGQFTDTGRELILQGDANSLPDSRPYDVSQALRILTPVPGLGEVVQVLRIPAVAGTMTVFVAAVVALTLWPTATSRDRSELRLADVMNRRGKVG